ncbi:MAG TPA: hypothetical protein VEF76_01390 [Patescibacteria group bacterium]|nr:hypothetical protein [Patescibacteria group bacterium]
MTDLSSKYPQLAKIFADQDKMFQYFTGDNAPVELKDVQNRAIDVLDRTIDRTDSEKEALAVGVVLMTAGPDIVGDPADFAKEYGANVNAFVDELTTADPADAPSTNISQVSTALAVIQLEGIKSAFQANVVPEEAKAQLAAAFAQSASQEAFVFKNLDAPKLQAAYLAAKNDVAVELGLAPANNNAPVPPKKKNGGGSFDL